jgi:hypothetical protein
VFLVDTGGSSLDSDGDGLPDWWEKLYFNDPKTADPLVDTDGDGYSNYAEFIAGTNPLDANSVFNISEVQATQQTSGPAITIRWASFDGSIYSIWSATLAQGPYDAVATNILATPPLNMFIVPLMITNEFFRIGVAR